MPSHDEISKALEAFQGATLQSVNQVKRKLEAYGISWHEFDEWLAKEKEGGRLPKRKHVRPQTGRECPVCLENGQSRNLKLMDVNATKCTQLGGPWKSMWYCGWCEWDEVSELTAAEEGAKHAIERSNLDPDSNAIRRLDAEVKSHRKKRTKKKKSLIVRPSEHRMLYYKSTRRRVR